MGQQRLKLIGQDQPVTVSDEDREAACAAVVHVFAGQYGLRKNDFEMPEMMLAGSEKINGFWQQKFGQTFDDFMDREDAEERIKKALGSFRLDTNDGEGVSPVVEAAKGASEVMELD